MEREIAHQSERFLRWWDYRFPHRQVTEWLRARKETQLYYYRKYLCDRSFTRVS